VFHDLDTLANQLFLGSWTAIEEKLRALRRMLERASQDLQEFQENYLPEQMLGA
jgi:hypothetical protein